MYWKEISSEEFLPYFRNIRVNAYLANLSELVGLRKSIIKSNSDWKTILEPSFLPDYKDQKSWKDPLAKNYLVIEKSWLSKEELRSYKDIIIITAYDSDLNKRLVVDGMKRSIAIQRLVNQNIPIPELELIECYGPNIKLVFKDDFLHLK
jgi:hypothetical protein